jgi:outer membrane protein insertion porin family
MQEAYNFAMRCRVAQIVVFTAVCLLMFKPNVKAQNENCPPDSASASDNKPSGPEVSISGVTFSGFIQLPIVDQDRIASSIKQQSYDTVDGVIEEGLERVRAGWQNHGYFKVQVTDEASTVTSTPGGQQVVLNVHVDEGLPYNLGGITFRNNRAMSDVKALRALFPIKDGVILSRERIAEGLDNLRKAYGELGYINYTGVPESSFDDEKKLAFLEIDIDEGKQFYLTRVEIVGLDDPSRREVLKDLRVGQVYNQRLFELALKKHASVLRFLPDDPWHVAKHMDEKMGTVEVALDARPCPVR